MFNPTTRTITDKKVVLSPVIRKLFGILRYFSSKKVAIFFLIAFCTLMIVLLINTTPPPTPSSPEYRPTAYPTPTISTNNSPTPTLVPPDYSHIISKPRTVYDTSEWETYENLTVGFRFKYPSKWGTPIEKLTHYTGDLVDLYSSDNQPSVSFLLKFPESDFQVGGGSSNYAPSRGANILYDYAGFGSGHWDPDKICASSWVIYCQPDTDQLDYLTIPACTGEPALGFGYERVRLLNLNQRLVNGLAFGGQFIPKTFQGNTFVSCQDNVRQIIGNAIVSRKIDDGILYEYDLFEKVFETIELF